MDLKERTAENMHTAFVEEAKAYQRLLLFAEKAERESLPQIAHLFRAVAAAEGVHSRRYFALLESIGDTQTNLERAFQSETAVSSGHYTKMLQEAGEDGAKTVTLVFSQARDVEKGHVELYKKAIEHLVAERITKYFVCKVCGYVAEAESPERCPICSAPKSKFEKVD